MLKINYNIFKCTKAKFSNFMKSKVFMNIKMTLCSNYSQNGDGLYFYSKKP